MLCLCVNVRAICICWRCFRFAFVGSGHYENKYVFWATDRFENVLGWAHCTFIFEWQQQQTRNMRLCYFRISLYLVWSSTVHVRPVQCSTCFCLQSSGFCHCHRQQKRIDRKNRVLLIGERVTRQRGNNVRIVREWVVEIGGIAIRVLIADRCDWWNDRFSQFDATIPCKSSSVWTSDTLSRMWNYDLMVNHNTRNVFWLRIVGGIGHTISLAITFSTVFACKPTWMKRNPATTNLKFHTLFNHWTRETVRSFQTQYNSNSGFIQESAY